MAERLDYEARQKRSTPPPGRGRPFWPPGLHRVDFIIIFGIMLTSAFSDDYLGTRGWTWWQKAAVLIVLTYAALYTRRAFSAKP